MSVVKSIGKNLSNKYNQKLLHSAKKSTTDAKKTASKRAIQKKKTVEGTGDLIRNKIPAKQQKPQKIIWKKLKMKQIYQRKDIYLQKKVESY